MANNNYTQIRLPNTIKYVSYIVQLHNVKYNHMSLCLVYPANLENNVKYHVSNKHLIYLVVLYTTRAKRFDRRYC